MTGRGGSPCDVVANVLDCRLEVSEFDLLSSSYVHFRTDIPGERYEPFYPPSNGLNAKMTKVDMPLNKETEINMGEK